MVFVVVAVVVTAVVTAATRALPLSTGINSSKLSDRMNQSCASRPFRFCGLVSRSFLSTLPAAAFLLMLAPALLPASAQGTRLWTQSKLDEFEKGTPQGVEITSNGKLRRGPVAAEVVTTQATFVWSVAANKAGTIYLATGSPATIQRVEKDGKTTTLFESKAVAVQVLRTGPDGSLYAATLPDGKVYRIRPDAPAKLDESNAEVVFDLAKMDDEKNSKPDAEKQANKSHYIWDMTFDSAGRLYIATGGPAAIYRLDVKQTGAKPELFFKSDEQHIRVLTWDKSGNLLAGSDGSGLVYRIDPNGKGYVLFSAPRREITALAVGADGTIYSADVGDKSHNPLSALPVQSGGIGITINFLQPGSVQAANASAALPDGTEIYALTPNAAPKKLWSGKEEVVYQLAATPDGLTVLTGNRGRILNIHSDGSFSDVAHLDALQAVSMLQQENGWLIGTANTGKLYRLSDHAVTSEKSDEHAYASDVLDAGATARWGRVETEPGSHGFQIWTRSGNVEQPVRNQKDWGWSDWQPVADGKIVSPIGRYLQWKVVLGDQGLIGGIGINYLPVNSAPSVDDVVVVPGARVTAQQMQSGQPPTVTIAFPNPGQAAVSTFDTGTANGVAPIQAQKDRSAVTVRWAAHDDDSDDLRYTLYLRGDGEHVWRLLKKDLTDKVYSFDGSAIPDGGYEIKVVASDAPSHTPGDALKGELTSERFELDTTAPVISSLKASAAVNANCKPGTCAQAISVSFDGKDATSPISHAEYSLDGGPWQYIEPVGELSDSSEEHYSFTAPLPSRGQANDESTPQAEHLVAVRVYDRYDNSGAAKVVVPASSTTGER